LYWQARQPITTNYTTFIHALGRGHALGQGEKVGEYNGYAGLGTFPPSHWPVGAIVEDRYAFALNAAATAPTLLRLNAGFFEAGQLDRPPLPITDSAGQPVSAQIATQVLEPAALSAPSTDDCTVAAITFADGLRLTCYQLTPQALTLHWQADDTPQQDYTLFIQLWQADAQVAGFDGPPLNGDLPTSLWRAGYHLSDVHALATTTLPAGDYRVLVGLYQAQSGERLPAFDAAGTPLPDYAFEVGEIEVGE
jgi:hypothetical protein